MLARRHFLSCAIGLGSALAAKPGQALERITVFATANRLVSIYQSSDAHALHGMLARGLQQDFTPSALSKWLDEARAMFGSLQRISMPTYGSRTHGVLAAYFDRGPCDMFLEIDREGKVLFWAFQNPSKVLTIRKLP